MVFPTREKEMKIFLMARNANGILEKQNVSRKLQCIIAKNRNKFEVEPVSQYR